MVARNIALSVVSHSYLAGFSHERHSSSLKNTKRYDRITSMDGFQEIQGIYGAVISFLISFTFSLSVSFFIFSDATLDIFRLLGHHEPLHKQTLSGIAEAGRIVRQRERASSCSSSTVAASETVPVNDTAPNEVEQQEPAQVVSRSRELQQIIVEAQAEPDTSRPRRTTSTTSTSAANGPKKTRRGGKR
jgi:hypothetical protein